MKLSELALKSHCVASYNVTMQSPAMQAVLASAIAADKARQAAQEARYKKIDDLYRECDCRTAAGENVFVNTWTLTVEAK